MMCTDKKEVYQYLLHNEIQQKYYVLKPIKMNGSYSQGNCHYLVTVHRKSASHEWYLQSYTEKIVFYRTEEESLSISGTR